MWRKVEEARRWSKKIGEVGRSSGTSKNEIEAME
jgi:hypothetical protein